MATTNATGRAADLTPDQIQDQFSRITRTNFSGLDRGRKV